MSRRSSHLPIFAACFFLIAQTAIAVEQPPSKPGEPTDPKARKTYADAIEWERHGKFDEAIGDYRKANQQDGGHCTECLQHAYRLAMHVGKFEAARDVAHEMLSQAASDNERAAAHYRSALAVQNLGMATKKDWCFTDSCEEFEAALNKMPQLAPAHYGLGLSYAHLHQDEDARREFKTFLEQDKSAPILHERAQHFLENIELARAMMAPPFSLTTLDGQHITMDELQGKVVLIDFWATWCTACREALPHIHNIAQEFAGQPLVVLSISLDRDEAKWKEFVAKNHMTWLQYRDGGSGAIANEFGVRAIPATFSIDADGVLQDQHVGDADIDWKLKKMVARAAELANRKAIESAAEKSSAPAN